MPALVPGRVVYPKVAIPDPQGQNPKEGRPFVVVSRREDIEKGEPILAVGITTELASSPAEHYVALPFGPTARTGLKQKCAALCTWLIEIPAEKLDVGKGFVRPDLLEEIVRKLLELNSIPQPGPED